MIEGPLFNIVELLYSNTFYLCVVLHSKQTLTEYCLFRNTESEEVT